VSRFFILLLIVLLPLRGWSADLMGMQMAAGQVAMSADCPMMAAMPASTPTPDSTHDDSDLQRSCQSCQLCMPLIALETLTLDTLTVKPQAPQAHHVARFDSAELARAVKPPIA
jgi:hypothetical protein